MEESADRVPEKVATAVLSTTAKARQRAKRTEKQKAAKEAASRGDDDAMPIDSAPLIHAQPAPANDTIMISDERKPIEEDKRDSDVEKKKKTEKEKTGYEIGNLSRVLPEQLKYISFPAEGRYVPIKKVCIFCHPML